MIVSISQMVFIMLNQLTHLITQIGGILF